jgi:hypothetical protein
VVVAGREDDPQDLRDPEGREGVAAGKPGLTPKGTLRAPSPTTLTEAAEEWLESAQASVVRTRSGDRYKPSAFRSHQQL